MAMDKFTRNYSIIFGICSISLLGWWLTSLWQPRVWELNEMLTTDPILVDYAYQFRLRKLEQGVATLSTPRSFDVPAIRFLEVIHPELHDKAQDDPLVIAAQEDLIKHQKHAQVLMLSQPDIDRVEWELDLQWLADHGIHQP
jgi:hypothetical protein